MTLPVYSTRQFTFSAENKEFLTESSNLAYGSPFGEVMMGFDCNHGFVLESHRTGRRVRWIVSETLRDGEGDIQAWVLTSTDEVARSLKVVVIND